MRGLENIVRLKVNLKNWSWGVAPAYKIDENDARGLLDDIAKIEAFAESDYCREWCYYGVEYTESATICGDCPLKKLMGIGVKYDND